MRDPKSDVASFYASAWHLVSRGVLMPVRPAADNRVPFGDSFQLTEYGSQWIGTMSGYEWNPMEHGRIAQLLVARAERFGNAFRARSLEAAVCYRSHTYLACCTMCGAAAESILLALAVARSGDEVEILREYRHSDGRSRIEKKLLQGQNSHVHQHLPKFMELLKYWRDDAAHGADAEINEEVAFVSLLLLLRFAAFADDRWETLTARAGGQA
ncbi:MAG: hypothetical protein M3418_02145 [Gemmatimonadota bacterium]|nr:hypothetical protein [Gemmatimonadota bacterium]